jgi:glycosyltransferase involved in cell wall biosynthesis
MDPLNPNAGGDVKWLKETGKRLARDGYRVTWIASRFPGSAAEEEWEGVRILRTGSLFTVYFTHHLDRRTRRLPSHAVIVETVASIPFLTRIPEGSRASIVVHHVVPFSQMWRKVGPLGIASWVIERFLTPGLYRDRRVLVDSRGTEVDVRKLGYRNVTRLKLGADLVDFDFSLKEKLVLAPGPVKPWKHHDQIIQAFTLMDKSWKLVIFGGFETVRLRRKLESLVDSCRLRDRVEFCGHISEEAKSDLLKRAAICVFASEKEGWGLAAMEAQSAGCPVVAFDVPGLNESVIHNQTGILVPSRNTEGLGQAMAHLAFDEGLRLTLAQAAVLRAKDYDWESCYQDFRRNASL